MEVRTLRVRVKYEVEEFRKKSTIPEPKCN